eukprot:SAG11_NODE_3140_length_2658_cov_3.387261_1_plen_174_part_00
MMQRTDMVTPRHVRPVFVASYEVNLSSCSRRLERTSAGVRRERIRRRTRSCGGDGATRTARAHAYGNAGASRGTGVLGGGRKSRLVCATATILLCSTECSAFLQWCSLTVSFQLVFCVSLSTCDLVVVSAIIAACDTYALSSGRCLVSCTGEVALARLDATVSVLAARIRAMQ